MDEPSLQPSNSFSQYGRFKKQGFHLAEGGTLDSSRTCAESHFFFSTGLRVKNSEEIFPLSFPYFSFYSLKFYFVLFWGGGDMGGIRRHDVEETRTKKLKKRVKDYI